MPADDAQLVSDLAERLALVCGLLRIAALERISVAVSPPAEPQPPISRRPAAGPPSRGAPQPPATYPLLDGNQHEDLEDAYGPIDGLPRSVVIGRDGLIAFIHDGATLRPSFEKDLATLK